MELKKHLVPSENTKKGSSNSISYCFESYESTVNLRQYLGPIHGLQSKNSKDDRREEELPSMIGKEMIKNLKNLHKVEETVIRLRDGDQFMDIKTINIQQLVKNFALRIFTMAKIDVKKGRYVYNNLDSISSSFMIGSVRTRRCTRTTTTASTTRCGRPTRGLRSRSI